MPDFETQFPHTVSSSLPKVCYTALLLLSRNAENGCVAD